MRPDALQGLSKAQRAFLSDLIDAEGQRGGSPGAIDGTASSNRRSEGWWIYRVPSTGSNPHTVIFRKRGIGGKVVREFDVSNLKERDNGEI